MRLTALELTNFKNVRYGRLALSAGASGKRAEGADIIGIYGQNGSGKTSVIAALFILKALFQGDPLPEDMVEDCIALESETFSIACEGLFHVPTGEEVPWRYEVRVGRGEKGRCIVLAEKVTCKRCWAPHPSMATVFDYRRIADGTFEVTPKTFWGSLDSLRKSLATDFAVAQALSVEKSCSLFFSSALRDTIKVATGRYAEDENVEEVIDGDARANTLFTKKGQELFRSYAFYIFLMQSELWVFAIKNMVVLPPSNQVYSIIDILPIFSHEGDTGFCADACIKVDLAQVNIVSFETRASLSRTIDTIDQVLGALVPGLSVSIRSLGTTLLENGDEGDRIEIVATRGDTTVPLRCESEGIKRLVSVLNLLVDVYANADACVAIDELDAGLFEYLLGEILQVLEEHGRGQLIFTAHNLRPLETISKNSIVFTTTNPDNRYIPFKGHKATNNLRDQYLRAVYLGGQDEEVYAPTSKFAIDNAFYEAGVTYEEAR